MCKKAIKISSGCRGARRALCESYNEVPLSSSPKLIFIIVLTNLNCNRVVIEKQTLDTGHSNQWVRHSLKANVYLTVVLKTGFLKVNSRS